MMMPKNRRLPIWPTATAFGMMLFAVSSAMGEDAGDATAIEKAVKDRITVTATLKKTKHLNTVFTGQLYDVKIKIGQGNGSSTMREQIMAVDGKVTDVPSASTNQKMANLLKLVKKEFKLKTQEDANVFEAALDDLYPMRFDKDKKAIKKQDGNYVFIRGDFFKNLKGFIVTTDAQGTITDISYSLRIKP